MMQQVKIVAPNCGEASILLTATDGLIRPGSIAYIPNPDGSYKLVVANSMGNSGNVFSFDSSNKQTSKQALGPVDYGLSYVNYDGDNLVGITGNKVIGTFDASYNFVPYPTIPSIVDMRQVNSCGGFSYISADDNNDIFQCSDLSNPATCQPLCPMSNGDVGVTNPWSIGIGTDCSVYTASRGPGAGKIFKYDSSTCYQPVEIASLSNGGKGIKAIIPFFESAPGECKGYSNTCEDLCKGNPVTTCKTWKVDCGDSDQVNDYATKPCDANSQDCQTICCTNSIDGEWTQWSPYDPCSASCGGGKQTRERTCTNPSPANGGKSCVGESAEEKTCNTDACVIPRDGGWTQWSPYNPCSASCGGGKQTRERTCTNPSPANGGKNCVGESSEEKACNTDACVVPRDGGWTQWSPYNPCSASCGGGKQTRERTCTNPSPANGGKNCVGENSEEKACNTDACVVPRDGGWTQWSPYDPCSASCEGGKQTRERTCTNPSPANGGQSCVGESSEEKTCNTDACVIPRDGGWTQWSPFDPCSVSCGGGKQTRDRTCTNPSPANGGKSCVGDSSEEKTCNTDPCPRNDQWSQWSPFGSCSASCGGGKQTRDRTCTNPSPANGGKSCVGDSSEEKTCNTDPCPRDGQWTQWSPFDPCSVTCGGGTQERDRTCSNPSPANGGKGCAGDSSENQSCNTNPCPTNGSWSSWFPWGDCSAECGGGLAIRERDCDNPAPANGGSDCFGSGAQTKTCNDDPCITPVDGGWTQWTPYSPCSKTCGGGQQTSSRTCTNPTPSNGGADCIGQGSKTQDCNTQGCDVAPTCSSLNYDCGVENRDDDYDTIECDVSLGHNCQGRCCNPVDECNPWTQETCGPECQGYDEQDPDSFGVCCEGDFGCKPGICHSNGCDQCKDGFFKPDYHYDCLKCSETLDHCQFCQDYSGCGQCTQGYIRVKAGRSRGVETDFYVCVPQYCQEN
eukprot:Awhi_evm1s14222